MIDGRLILEGTIELTSPLLIGSGNKESTDIDVLLDAEGKPFIPATSFIGVLKDFMKIKGSDEKLKEFWGFSFEGDQRQSSISCSDLYCVDGNIPVVLTRDGIEINSKTGIVSNKYDYQVVEKGAKFVLHLETSYKKGNKEFCIEMFALIKSALEAEKIRIGAKTNNGLGKIKLIEPKFYDFDFSIKQDVFRWLKKEFSKESTLSKPKEPLVDNAFTINATLRLKNSFIIGSYSDIADSESIRSGNDFVMTGTALKGAIRNRAERILKTLEKPDDILKNLFGDVDKTRTTKTAIKSRIRVEEVKLPPYTSELQNRVKIDRFTGGVMSGAFFDSMPLFSRGEVIEDVKITITDFKDDEAGLIGLMLLVLKDLWTGDLAVGGEKNVGRGVFEGVEAEILWNGGEAKLKKDDLKDLPKLQGFVDALKKEAVNV